MELNQEQKDKVVSWASREVCIICELRGQKQKSGKSTDKKDSTKKNEFHYLELSLERMATGEHIHADFFGPREVTGPVPLIEAPRGSLLIVSFGNLVSDYTGTKGRVANYEILHRSSYASDAPTPGGTVQPAAQPVGKRA